MAEKTANGANLSLKLMVHKEEKRVIFAEADSDFVDTLFSIITLPLGTIVRILEKCPDEEVEALGSLKNLYTSLLNLSTNYLSRPEYKHMILNPKSSLSSFCRDLKLSIEPTELPKYSSEKPGVFLDNASTFIVTDDLQVKPSTPGFCIQLLCDFGITDASKLEERTFNIGHDQILILLKGAFLFKSSLTYMVFGKPHPSSRLVKASSETVIQNSTSNEAAAVSKKITLKVTLRKSNSKFLFAVVEGEFVGFLLGFLEITLGTVVGKLMKGNSSFESLDNLFASISAMNEGYFKGHEMKELLLEPDELAPNHVSKKKFFSFDGSSGYRRRSLVKASAKFLLTDDLVLTPVSSISTIAEMNKMKVPLNDVVEQEISLGFEEGVKLLKASMTSLSPLTDALLKANS